MIRVTLKGRLVAEPVVRKTKGGKQVTHIRVACPTFGDKVTFIPAQIWGREGIERHLKKGTEVYIDGEIHQENFSLNGKSISILRVNAQSIDVIRQPKSAQQALA